MLESFGSKGDQFLSFHFYPLSVYIPSPWLELGDSRDRSCGPEHQISVHPKIRKMLSERGFILCSSSQVSEPLLGIFPHSFPEVESRGFIASKRVIGQLRILSTSVGHLDTDLEESENVIHVPPNSNIQPDFLILATQKR